MVYRTFKAGVGTVLTGGTALGQASTALILLHGRGGEAAEIIELGERLDLSGTALLAPEAENHSWYPHSFLAPVEQNQPGLSTSLSLVQAVLDRCITSGIDSDHVGFLGFSQGACLASEFVARQPRRYAALVAFTGGLIGPVGSDLHHAGSLSGTTVLLSSGDPDPHVPWTRVEESAEQFRSMGGSVWLNRLPGKPHTISREEMQAARDLLCTAFFGGDVFPISRTK